MSGVSQALRDGIAAAQARQFEQARPLLEQATAASPGDPVGWFWLAIAAPSAATAIPCLRRVLEIDASHERSRTALAKLLMTEAVTVAATGNRAAARALVAEAAQVTPSVQTVWLRLAATSEDQDERIHALRQAIAIAPDEQVRTRLRQALLARGMTRSSDRAEARACFREAAELDPSDPRVWQALASLADSPAECVDALRELLRVAPNHPNGRTALRNALAADAHALARAELVDEAYLRWQEVMALTGGDVEAWLGVAATASDPNEAERAVMTAFKLNPADERAVAAMDRLRRSKIDPATVAPPADAFARFELPDTDFAALESPDDAFEPLDASLDAFAQLAVPAPEPAREIAAVAPRTLEAEPPRANAAAASAPLHTTPVPAAAPRQTPPANPTLTPSAAAALVPQISAVVEARPNGSSRRTVMVVDDSPTIRQILGLTLERAGYRVVAEPDGESALERLLQVVPDLILLDIAMPKLDGYEVCKRIKQDPRTAEVPVVMLSGKGAFFDKVKGHMAGATEYLTKPFETPAVLAVVAGFCQPSAEVVHG